MNAANKIHLTGHPTEQDRADFLQALREMGSAGYVCIHDDNPLEFLELGGISLHHETAANQQ